ncbi:allophanate hydrolase [Opitutaceae bacterium EW11]|nr:allophanate hydrolase [Opitutaceae bacterium EW11]
MASHPLDLAALQSDYRSGLRTPEKVLSDLYDRIEAEPNDPTWIHVIPRTSALERVPSPGPASSDAPLRGVPFAVKDNIDVAGVPTTAACPDFKYTPTASAFVVDRLVAAGAVPVGKTNLDQFATGLVGVRSPYGIPRNPFNSEYIPGGSSSGSAVAVARGLCSFALGTDTAGSGRVPAAFLGLVGLKPTRGLLSTRGVVPACRSLDCVSVFTRSCGDAAQVLAAAAGYDEADPYSRKAAPPHGDAPWPPRIGVPRRDQREFFGNAEAEALFERSIARWTRLGASIHEIDFSPFRDAARLLYEGAWVAERYAAIRNFVEEHPGSLHPVTEKIVTGARKLTAVDAFESEYRLAALRRASEAVWSEIDVLLTPTTGTAYRVADVMADPIRLNSQLGYYTNFMNLLDLCGLAVPAGTYSCGVHFGVTLVAPAFHDDRILALGARFLGEAAPGKALPTVTNSDSVVRLAVCGAHLSGLSLNSQLTERGAHLIAAAQTAAEYRLYALPGATPPKPGLVRVLRDGVSIALEIWELPVDRYGDFVALIPAPLGIGRLKLRDGSLVQGFVCESAATEGARDISEFGGWRSYLASQER